MPQVGTKVGESAEATARAPEEALDDAGFAEFVVAGTRGSGEFRCADCGYGAVVRRVVPQCPMCSGAVWESRGAPPVRRLD